MRAGKLIIHNWDAVMNSKTKKIIAREGLIILSLIGISLTLGLLSFALFSIPFISVYQVKSSEGETYEVEVKRSVGEGVNDSLDLTDEGRSEIVKAAFNGASEGKGYAIELIHKNLPHSLFPFIRKIALIMVVIATSILIFVYPFYLLVRFVIRAAKVLQENN